MDPRATDVRRHAARRMVACETGGLTMNRKRAIAARLAAVGNVVAVAVVRGQQEGRRPLPAPTQQELATQGDLEREVTALRAQVQELSRIQAGTVGFTKVE